MSSAALILQPIGRLTGTLQLPGSKSLSNRILLLSALAEGRTVVENLLDSDDIQVMVQALRQLGVAIEGDPSAGKVRVQGVAGPLPGGRHTLNLGNAGTAMRPLTAVLALGKGTYELGGVPRMHERPIGDLVRALASVGARIEYLGAVGFPPLRIEADGLKGGTTTISGTTSSQFVSALLMAAPYMAAGLELSISDHLVSKPYVAMTAALMERFGVKVARQGAQHFAVAAGQCYLSPERMAVEGDASSASYFLAGAAITGGEVTVLGCGTDSLQGDARFATLLEQMGAEVTWSNEAVRVRGTGRLRGIDADLESMPDAAMTLAVAALFAEGPTTLRGIANWRVKETDRMVAMENELAKVGAVTEVGADQLTVHPPRVLKRASIATYDDHRMAMAFSLAACGPNPITIEDPECVAKTFPDYFQKLAELSQAS